MLIPLVSVAVSITLLPVLLDTVGPRLERARAMRRNERSARHWHALAAFVVRHRVPSALASGAVLVALAAAAISINVGGPDPRSTAATGGPRQALDTLIASGIGEGPLSPYDVITPRGSAQQVATRISAVPGIRGAVAPSGPGWTAAGTSLITVIPQGQGDSSSGRATLAAVRRAAHPVGPEVKVGGLAAQNVDFVSAVYGGFGWMLALIAVATYLLLARAFRSLLLPLKALLMNALSVSAAYGVITLIFQKGYGSQAIFNTHSTGAIISFIPLLAFAFLFGLSMDYEVFLLSRIREEYNRTGSTDEAIVSGLSRTGRLITAAALILFLAFVALASAPDTPVRVFATALGAGILIDATLVRAILVPAVISLMGRWNWWMPTSVARILRVEQPAAKPALAHPVPQAS
jgi:RND superfamily putative drug exporter